jgi:hypothetical protein
MRRGAGSLLAMGPRTSGGLVILALCAQGLAAFAPPPLDPCACTDAACCRAAKKPAPARASCHDDQEPASLRCHHPEQDVQLPATIALLPAPTAFAPAELPREITPRAGARPLAGFSRLDLPPPRSPRPVLS